MNPSSSSSLSSPPLYKSSSRPQSSTTINRETPSIIPLDYNYQIMAPSSLRPQTSRYNLMSRSSTQQSQADGDVYMDEDLPYNSLFGDPVPPPPLEDFLTTTFTPTEYLRSPANDLSSEEEPTMTSSAQPQRLFSQVPYTNIMGRRYSHSSSTKNFEVMPSNIPRLKPPDIQILPNSSGGSSSEAQNSPNYLLLAPQDIITKPLVYESNKEPTDVSELKETYTISDKHSRRELSQLTTKKLGIVGETQDIQVLSPPKEFQSSTPRQFSNESYSSGEWFRSTGMDYPEFNKMPKLRPSSKNVMSIKRDEMPMDSPVAAMINDSNGSSSGEERQLGATQTLDQPSVCLDSLKPPERPPSPSPSCLRSLDEAIILTPKEYIKQRRKSIYPTELQEQESVSGEEEEEKPPPIPPKPQLDEKNNLVEIQPETLLKREISPVIFKDSITTGGDFRVDQTRLHKKTAFTIISDKSPQSSRVQSPHFLRSRELTTPALLSPTQITKDPNKYQLKRKSLSSTQLKLPHLSSQQLGNDDSPRPSVQFDMSGRYSPSKLPFQKGILQNKESLTAAQDTLPIQLMRRRSSILPPGIDPVNKPPFKSCETLPLITDPYRTSIPRLNRSTLEMGPENAVFPPGALPRPVKPNPNPTRKQKGLLKVLNHEESLSRIPLKSNWSSMDDLWLERKGKAILTPIQSKTIRRRSSSTSPSRRSSTQTTSDRRSSNISTITTSDFSFRRPSLTAKPKTPQAQRRKSVFQAPSPTTVRRKSSSTSSVGTLNTQGRSRRPKIAKPTTLSPIIGTPNKDSSSAQSPQHILKDAVPSLDSCSETNSRRDSLSKIPVRSQANSRSNSRLGFQAGSKAASRSGSPTKDIQGSTLRSRSVTPIGGQTSQIAARAATHSRNGSPLKDYKHSTTHLSQMTEERKRSNSQMSGKRSTAGSPSKGHSQIPASRSGSRASQYMSSQPGSRAQSQANSRAPSRSTSRASTRPISLPDSRPTSRMEQAKEIANSRSNSRLSIHSSRRAGSVSPSAGRKTSSSKPVSRRRKSVSLSPKGKRKALSRRGSISPAGMKSRISGRGRSRSVRPSPERLSRSRIPISHSNGRSPTKSPPRKNKLTAASDLRRTSSLKSKAKIPIKQPASAKKIPTSVRKSESGVKITPSATGKHGAVIKKQTSSIQKPSSVKKESSNVAKKSNVGAREASSLNVKKKPVTTSKTNVPGKNNGKDSQSEKRVSETAGKNTGAKLEAKTTSNTTATNAEEQQKSNEAVVASQNTEEKTNTSATGAGTATMLAGMRRQPSTVSLMRVSSKISLLKKRSDSNISKKTLDLLVPEVETSEVKAASPTQQLAEMALADGASIPAAILEKSQKTLENIQKTVAEATEEIQKTIHENLTDLKSLEQDMGLASDSAGSPTASVKTVVEKKPSSSKQTGESVSRQGIAESLEGKHTSKSPLPPTQPIEAAVSVLNPEESHTGTSAMSNSSSQVDSGAATQLATAATERSYHGETKGDVDDKVLAAAMEPGAVGSDFKPTSNTSEEGYETEAKRRSPDGQGGSQTSSGKGSDSQEYLEKKSLADEEDGTPKGCCSCCAKFCIPCRRSRCSRCCQRKKSLSPQDEAKRPVLSATSSATTTHLEVVDEKQPQKTSCWQKLNCCRNCRKQSQSLDSSTSLKEEETFKEQSFRPMGPPQQSKCGLCLSKIFCCRSVNKIDPKTGDETEVKKCCFCIPCRKKRAAIGHSSAVSSVAGGSTAAWQDPEGGTATTDVGQVTEPQPGCCKRFCNFLLCCRKKKVEVVDSRRPSIRAPPPEDTRRKLHADLVEYTSKMKGAIPVLPLWLAWFCVICNVIVPGLGTLLSGLFCLCVGIPRFSQYDSAKARLGSFIINTIVAVSQLFCVLFCFVGWGWSIWWGTIMLKCAKKLCKIRKVEKLEMEEEKRQAAAAEAAAAAAVKTTVPAGTSETEPAKT